MFRSSTRTETALTTVEESPTRAALPAQRRRPSARSLVATVVTMAALLVGGVATAAPASAATVYGNVTVCFSTGGYAYTGPTGAQTYNGSKWVTGAMQPGTSSGCRTWKVASGTWVSFYAYLNVPTGIHGSYFASGSTPAKQSIGGQTVNAGTWNAPRYYY